MELFGYTFTRTENLPAVDKNLQSVDGSRGWARIWESYTGAWQQNVEVNTETVLSYHAVFACMTLIASDISKLRVKLMAKDGNIRREVKNSAYSPVLRKPNKLQTRIQFYEHWVLSKLARGNTYVLKQRDNRGVVTALHVLDPQKVEVLLTPDGEAYYRLQADNVAGLTEATVVVPAREIIHDRFNCLFHPMVGLSPIYASGLASTQGLNIQEGSTNFFKNGSRPGGLLVSPNRIDKERAAELKETWDANYTGLNAGKVAVLGDGLKFESLATQATDAQLIEQLKLTAEIVCSTFRVPPYKVGIGTPPSANNVQALNLEYYSQCLQSLIEQIELSLDEGLAVGEGLCTEFDLDGLLRMDSATQIEVLTKAKDMLTLNERRERLNAPPVEGGEAVYMQQQDHSNQAIAARDAQLIDQYQNPPEPTPEPVNDDEPEPDEQQERGVQRAMLRAALWERTNAD